MIFEYFSNYYYNHNSLILTTIIFYNIICNKMYKKQYFDVWWNKMNIMVRSNEGNNSWILKAHLYIILLKPNYSIYVNF